MPALLLALGSYLLGALFDIAAIRDVPRAKPFLAAGLAIAHLAGIYRLASHSRRFPAPRPLQRLCTVLAPLGMAGMGYSIFVEVPLRKGWLERGHVDELVTDGTYSLTRHPGVLWYAGWVLCAAVATRSRRLLAAAPLLVAGDVAHVAFQERFVLLPRFGEAYRAYQRTTPMLIPDGRSLRRFVRALLCRDTAPT